MRYRVIDNKRLNVYLTRQDLIKENVSIEDVLDGSPESVVKIKKIFSVVSSLAEFDISDSGLNIVLMPIIDGDLLISGTVSNAIILTEKEAEVFVYDDFENVAYACQKAWAICSVTSALYLFEKEYYLCVKADRCLMDGYNNFTSILCEFGRKSELSHIFIKEHGKTILDCGAIEKIKRYFSK